MQLLNRNGFLEMPGKGSYGAVYKARDLKTSEMVAIKVISLSEGVCIILCSFVMESCKASLMGHWK